MSIPCRKTLVLVVDDEAECCRSLAELLELEGFEAVTCSGGDRAVRALASPQRAPDVVLADVRMPGVSGLVLLKHIQERCPAMPVFLMSAFPDEDVWNAALQAGALDVFPKPIQAPALLRALREATSGGSDPRTPVRE